MSQRWVGKERDVRIAGVPPGERASCDAIVRSGERPFRVTSVVASTDGFRLVQCLAGRRALLKAPAAFPVTGIFGGVDPGGVVTVEVENTGAEARDFAGKLVGEELVPG